MTNVGVTRASTSVLLGLGTILLSGLISGCGGGSNVTNPSSPAGASITAVSVVCSPSSVAAGSTSQCTATVQGTGSFASTVTWTATGGTIASSGVFTAGNSSGNATVTATSTQDSTKSGNATLAIKSPSISITQVTVSCSPTSVAAGATAQCSASVQGTGGYSPAVTWTAVGGTVDANGLFTAGATIGSATVTATSVQDTSKSGSATLGVIAGAPAVTAVAVTCTPATIGPGATSQCAATVQGTGTFSSAVTWTATGGTINASGLFTAPGTMGSAKVTATSVQTPSISGQATVSYLNQTPASKHVVLVMEENTAYESVVGNTTGWPHLNALMATGALATNYYADSHPSIPNYFMITTGQIVTTNDSSTTVFNVDNIARRLLAAGTPFRIYAEGITRGYVGGDTGLYVRRHNPFSLLSDVAANPQVAQATIWPFSQFATDVANNALPEFSFIIPDLNDDAHSSSPPVADDWLQANVVAPLTTAAAFQPGGDGLLVVDFDESLGTDTAHGGGHVSPVLWGPIVKPGFKQTSGTLFQHESMLRTVMEALRLSNPPGAAATAPSMAEFFVQP